MPETAFELRSVTHGYARARNVLRNASLVCDPGARIGIVGPSGSGKTTLLGIAGLLIPPQEGSVVVAGREVHTERQASRLRREFIAWILQTTNVLGDRSALDNVAVALVARGADPARAQDIASRALDRVGLTAASRDRARNLSGGELQRLAVARAMATQPSLLIADEPTASLDAANRDMVVDSLFSNLPTQTALLLASHDAECYVHCDQLYELRDGHLTRMA